MPQISEREFEVLPLRGHAFLADVPRVIESEQFSVIDAGASAV